GVGEVPHCAAPPAAPFAAAGQDLHVVGVVEQQGGQAAPVPVAEDPGGFRGADQVVWVAGAVHRREGPAALVDAPEGVDLVQPVPVPAVAADVGHGREAGD